jgi:thymidylate synthase
MSQYTDFKFIYQDLYYDGEESSPRGMRIKELEHYSYRLDPFIRFTNFKNRKLNINYIKQEFLWYLRGDRHDMSICEHAKMWDQVKKQDSNGNYYINSNYGYYVFTKGGMQYVINELKKDKDSRRASISILGSEPEHWDPEAKDVPCTYSLNFRIRNNVLNCSVHMRSQDCFWGMGQDLPCFSFIQEMIFIYMKEFYPELEMGEYCHTADSFHVYERHFEMLEKILLYENESDFTQIDIPRISGKDECDFLLTICKDTNVPEQYKFSRWLLGIE